MISISNKENIFIGGGHDRHRIISLDALTGGIVWESPLLLGKTQMNSFSFSDIDSDGLNEAIFGVENAMYVTH